MVPRSPHPLWKYPMSQSLESKAFPCPHSGPGPGRRPDEGPRTPAVLHVSPSSLHRAGRGQRSLAQPQACRQSEYRGPQASPVRGGPTACHEALRKSFAAGGLAPSRDRDHGVRARGSSVPPGPVSARARAPHPCATLGSASAQATLMRPRPPGQGGHTGPWDGPSVHPLHPGAHRTCSTGQNPRQTISSETWPHRGASVPSATAPERRPHAQPLCGPPQPSARLGSPCPAGVPHGGSKAAHPNPRPKGHSGTPPGPASWQKSRTPRPRCSRARRTWGQTSRADATILGASGTSAWSHGRRFGARPPGPAAVTEVPPLPVA